MAEKTAIEKLFLKWPNKEFERGQKCPRMSTEASEYHLPAIELHDLPIMMEEYQALAKLDEECEWKFFDEEYGDDRIKP
ncbi:MAG: hypothetical protein NG712_04410 [Omnitrophica bacterium]|nr:hypothetical protein [Candidatus Omnitrophota bacterium]